VAAVAARANAPYAVANKERLGDRRVVVTLLDLSPWAERRAVLIDDIVSSGRTMIEAARTFAQRGMKKPYCLAVHALFAESNPTKHCRRWPSASSRPTPSRIPQTASASPELLAGADL
jgi:phosphoribosylpyrophosphate synthetase